MTMTNKRTNWVETYLKLFVSLNLQFIYVGSNRKVWEQVIFVFAFYK